MVTSVGGVYVTPVTMFLHHAPAASPSGDRATPTSQLQQKLHKIQIQMYVFYTVNQKAFVFLSPKLLSGCAERVVNVPSLNYGIKFYRFITKYSKSKQSHSPLLSLVNTLPQKHLEDRKKDSYFSLSGGFYAVTV